MSQDKHNTVKRRRESNHDPSLPSAKKLRTKSTSTPCQVPADSSNRCVHQNFGRMRTGPSIRKVLAAKRAHKRRSRSKLFLGKYHKGQLLGQGGFGRVYAGIRDRDGLPVAIKTIPKCSVTCCVQEDDKLTPSEVYFQSQCLHQNIIKLFRHHVRDDSHVLILERPRDCTDLLTYIGQQTDYRLHENEARVLFRQLVEAVAYLDTRDILHNDLKPENILVDLTESPQVKLIDFGLAYPVQDKPITSFCGTIQYGAPEYHTHHQYDGRQATVWSLGCVMFEMLVGGLAFENPKQAATGSLHIPGHISPDASDLLRHMLSRCPQQRASLKQVLRHPWLK